MNINKITFFDVETVGESQRYEEVSARKAELWATWQEKYKESNEQSGLMTLNDVWENKAGLHAEYAKAICVSFGYYKGEEEKITSIYGDDETDILKKVAIIMNNSDAQGMILGGHNIERFDIPFLWKRMLINGIRPPNCLNNIDKKPWDIKMFDTAKVWGGGSYKESFTSLDTITAALGIDSPKKNMHGHEVHERYYSGDLELIKTYCEGDVRATMQVANKILNTIK